MALFLFSGCINIDLVHMYGSVANLSNEMNSARLGDDGKRAH